MIGRLAAGRTPQKKLSSVRPLQVCLDLTDHEYGISHFVCGQEYPPELSGVKVAAAAALGEMPSLTGCTCVALGVKMGVNAGDSTLRVLLGLQHSTQLQI